MTTCRYAGPDQPRVLTHRHLDNCSDRYDDEPNGCTGCMPCTEPHCRRCAREHSTGACPSCLTDTRDTIADIVRMCADLPAEVEVKGIESEAFNLLGPTADPEALGHMSASVAVGRIPADWLEVADNELHPLLVAGEWMEIYLEAFEHDEPARITVASALSYLDRNLSEAGELLEVPFEDMARDLASCRAHMERVLHDGEQIETGAPCMDCSRPLTRYWGTDQAHDGWECRRCRVRRSEAEYRLNVLAEHQRRAEWLTDKQMQERTNVRAGTVREWARKGDVGRRRHSGRVEYAVADVERVAKEKGMMSA